MPIPVQTIEPIEPLNTEHVNLTEGESLTPADLQNLGEILYESSVTNEANSSHTSSSVLTNISINSTHAIEHYEYSSIPEGNSDKSADISNVFDNDDYYTDELSFMPIPCIDIAEEES